MILKGRDLRSPCAMLYLAGLMVVKLCILLLVRGWWRCSKVTLMNCVKHLQTWGVTTLAKLDEVTTQNSNPIFIQLSLWLRIVSDLLNHTYHV
jgi:hypothetical protein